MIDRSVESGSADVTPPTLPTPLVLVVGLGERGGRVVAGLEREPPFGPDDGDPSRHLNRMTLLHRGSASPDHASVLEAEGPRYLAGLVVQRLERMLGHAATEHARRKHAETSKFESPTSVTVLLFADLGEDDIRVLLKPIVEQLQQLVDDRLYTIVNRVGKHRYDRMRLVPVLTVPTAHSFAASSQAEVAVTELLGLLNKVEMAEVRLVPTVYLMEEITDISLLSSLDIDAMLENFALLVAETGGGEVEVLSDGTKASRNIWGFEEMGSQTAVSVTLSAFSVARGEPFKERILDYLRTRRGIRIFEALLGARLDSADTRKDGDVGGPAARSGSRRFATDELSVDKMLAAIGLPLLPPPELAKELRQGIHEATMSLRTFAADPHWSELKEKIDQHWGPLPSVDTGAQSSDLPLRGKAVLSKARNALDTMLDSAFDKIGSQLREKLASLEMGTIGEATLSVDQRIQAAVDEILVRDPNVRSHREAQLSARQLLSALRDHLAEIAPIRDGLALDEVSFKATEAALGEATMAAAALPDFRVLFGFFVLAVSSLTLLLAPTAARILVSVADRLVWVGPGRFVLSFVISLLVLSLLVWLVVRPTLKRARVAWSDVAQAIDAVAFGERGSMLSHFQSRMTHAWAVGYGGALGRAVERIEADLERLRAFDRALMGARSRFESRIDDSGLDAKDAPSDGRRPLVWPLVTPAALEDARTQADNDEALANDVCEFLRQSDMYRRWRVELPFLDDNRMLASLHRLQHDDVLFKELAKTCVQEGSAFAIAQWRSLPKTLFDDGKSLAGFEGIVLPDSALAGELPAQSGTGSLDKIAYFAPPKRSEHARWYAIRVNHGITVEVWKRGRHRPLVGTGKR